MEIERVITRSHFGRGYGPVGGEIGRMNKRLDSQYHAPAALSSGKCSIPIVNQTGWARGLLMTINFCLNIKSYRIN